MLDDLKNESIFTFNLWKSAGRPQSGAVFEMKKNAKYRYKLAIRDAANQFEDKFNDVLLDSYMNKDFNSFWRCWKKKTCSNKNQKTNYVDGCSVDIDIANKFADHFSVMCDKKNGPMTRPTIYDDSYTLYETHDWLLNVDDVRNAICNSLKKGKAAGADNITAEHILYADPILDQLLCNLFNLIIHHGYVPTQFGSGIIIPLIKDRLGDATKLDNYRAITLCSVISKLFEFCVSLKFGNFLYSNDLQFGFKKGIGCADAIHVVQQVVEHFNVRGSTVFISSLDASKAFDRVDHNTLFTKLLDRNMPLCIIKVLSNWYGKLYASVRWNNTFSGKLTTMCGVRQGSVLSPFLFNIYVDDLFIELESSGYGCSIGNKFFGCVMYADDLLLLSASVCGLQAMLDLCYSFGLCHFMIFNSKKSLCCLFGSDRLKITPMKLGDQFIEWVNSFKYLGVTFNSAGSSGLHVDCNVIKRKFYAACNSILCHSRRNDQLVKVHLVKSFCLPLLTYCLGAIEIPRYKIKDLGVCWNDCFRKIFDFHRWESVKELQWFLGELPFVFIYDLYRWRFLTKRYISVKLCLLLDLSNLQSGYVSKLAMMYGEDITLKQDMAAKIANYFTNCLST